MKLARRTFVPNGTDPTSLDGRLGPGLWLVEAGSVPPPPHRPSNLVGRFVALGGMAVSLRTDTLLGIELGRMLVDQLGRDSCGVGPLAGVALHEILVNAAVHGNLQVESGPACEWQDLERRAHRIAAALRDPVRSARLVTAVLSWNATHVQAVIIDEGIGDQSGDNKRNGAAPHGAAGRGRLIARAAARVAVLRGGSCTRLLLGRVTQPVLS